MKKLISLLVVLAAVSMFVSVAFADGPEHGTFVTEGTTDPYSIRLKELDNGKTGFRLKASGTVTGYFEGTWSFKEWGVVNELGQGPNWGVLTIDSHKDDDSGKVVILFWGQADPYTGVEGTWNVLKGKGDYKDLRGHGTYTGTPGICIPQEGGDPPFLCFPFTVTYDGLFFEHD